MVSITYFQFYTGVSIDRETEKETNENVVAFVNESKLSIQQQREGLPIYKSRKYTYFYI